MSKTYVFFAEGFEEVEALTVVDLLRRAEIETSMVSITGEQTVTGAHGITIMMDALLDEINMGQADALILPGGMPGTRNLQKCERLVNGLVEADKAGKLVCAIWKTACCYPSFEEELFEANVSFEPVCHDGNVITSRGMGTAIAFAGEIIATLVSKDKEKEITDSILYSVH